MINAHTLDRSACWCDVAVVESLLKNENVDLSHNLMGGDARYDNHRTHHSSQAVVCECMWVLVVSRPTVRYNITAICMKKGRQLCFFCHHPEIRLYIIK